MCCFGKNGASVTRPMLERVEENSGNWHVPIAWIVADELSPLIDQLTGIHQSNADGRRLAIHQLPLSENSTHPENKLSTHGSLCSVFGHARCRPLTAEYQIGNSRLGLG